VGTGSGDQYLWFVRRTLVANENIYFRGQVSAASTASYNEFVCLILKLGGTNGLTTNDFVYAEATHVGDAPAAAITSGASSILPAAGDWLLLTCSRWLVDSTTANMQLYVNDGTHGDVNIFRTNGGNTADERVFGSIKYTDALPAGNTVTARFRSGTAATNDCVSTKIFGLRLNAFQDHAGSYATGPQHSVVDTYQEYAGFPTYVKATTGPFICLGFPIHNCPETTKRPYTPLSLVISSRQSASTSWPAFSSLATCSGRSAATNQNPIGCAMS
jgi:hypothetical protein